MLRTALIMAVATLGLTACASSHGHGPPPPYAPSAGRVTPPPPPIEAIRPKV
jgi:hypothetical protein